MKRFGDKVPHWKLFTREFVLNRQDNPRVETFVKNVHAAKLEVERKMRRDLDSKLVGLGTSSVYFALGAELVRRIRTYIKFLKVHNAQMDHQEKSHQK